MARAVSDLGCVTSNRSGKRTRYDRLDLGMCGELFRLRLQFPHAPAAPERSSERPEKSFPPGPAARRIRDVIRPDHRRLLPVIVIILAILSWQNANERSDLSPRSW